MKIEFTHKGLTESYEVPDDWNDMKYNERNAIIQEVYETMEQKLLREDDIKWFWASSEDSDYWTGPKNTLEELLNSIDTTEFDSDDDKIYYTTGKLSNPFRDFYSDVWFDNHSEGYPENSPLEEGWGDCMEATDKDFKLLNEMIAEQYMLWLNKQKLKPWYIVDEMGVGITIGKVKDEQCKGTI